MGEGRGPRRVLAKKTKPCCKPPGSACAPKREVRKTTSEITFAERLGHVRCRLGPFRMNYRVEPGLYALGEPGRGSDVFVTANYKLSFDALRSSLKGLNAWILVLDTKGINVWCAAGKGTFGTEELSGRILDSGLSAIVSHRRVILPQLGAPGVAAHEVKRATGFKVYYGPVKASDIQAYIKSGYNAGKEMRRVEFPLKDRLVLTGIELRAALVPYLAVAFIVFLLSGLSAEGLSFERGLRYWPYMLLTLLSIASGALLTPALLPFIPFRSFAMKGWVAGLVVTGAAMKWLDIGPLAGAASMALFPALSSYLAFQFTGASTFTNISGVKKEFRYALPLYGAALAASAILFVAAGLKEWGFI